MSINEEQLRELADRLTEELALCGVRLPYDDCLKLAHWHADQEESATVGDVTAAVSEIRAAEHPSDLAEVPLPVLGRTIVGLAETLLLPDVATSGIVVRLARVLGRLGEALAHQPSIVDAPPELLTNLAGVLTRAHDRIHQPADGPAGTVPASDQDLATAFERNAQVLRIYAQLGAEPRA